MTPGLQRQPRQVFYQKVKAPCDILQTKIRRCSRSVAANIAEGFRKRQYPKMFVNKLADADSEATETQVWL
ncbi:MAG: four helix bundle protein, partial [Chloroflexi bacterium]|nr:four helix bundle protein [Chloroflexota bacterium]